MYFMNVGHLTACKATVWSACTLQTCFDASGALLCCRLFGVLVGSQGMERTILRVERAHGLRARVPHAAAKWCCALSTQRTSATLLVSFAIMPRCQCPLCTRSCPACKQGAQPRQGDAVGSFRHSTARLLAHVRTPSALDSCHPVRKQQHGNTQDQGQGHTRACKWESMTPEKDSTVLRASGRKEPSRASSPTAVGRLPGCR